MGNGSSSDEVGNLGYGSDTNPRQIPDQSSGSMQDVSMAPSSLTDMVKRIVEPVVEDAEVPNKNDMLLQSMDGETVMVAFHWSYGGSEVYVTGSFTNWQGKLKAHPNEDKPGEFLAIISLPPGTYQYQFIVDGKWQLDPNEKIIMDGNGVKNNILEINAPVFEFDQTFDEAFYDDSDDGSSTTTKNEYGQFIPPVTSYMNLPPKMPPQLFSKQHPVNSPTNEEDPYALPMPMHVILNHFFISEGLNEVSAEHTLIDVNDKRITTPTTTPTTTTTATITTITTTPSTNTIINATNTNASKIDNLDSKEKCKIANDLQKNVLVTACTQRFQPKSNIMIAPKFVTLIYYHPLAKSLNDATSTKGQEPPVQSIIINKPS